MGDVFSNAFAPKAAIASAMNDRIVAHSRSMIVVGLSCARALHSSHLRRHGRKAEHPYIGSRISSSHAAQA